MRKYTRPETRAIIAKVNRLTRRIDSLCYAQYFDLYTDEKVMLAEVLNPLISNSLALAWKFGLCEIYGLGLYAGLINDGKLTKMEIIREMLSPLPSRGNPIELAKALRKLADVLEASQ